MTAPLQEIYERGEKLIVDWCRRDDLEPVLVQRVDEDGISVRFPGEDFDRMLFHVQGDVFTTTKGTRVIVRRSKGAEL